MTGLSDDFLRIPLAHRAYHDVTAGRPENSIEAIRAAIDLGYGIEVDLQMSGDGQVMVFHDYVLERLTDQTGAVAQRTAAELGSFTLIGGDAGIPTLTEVLAVVAGRVPLLLEIKDQDGVLGTNVGPMEQAIAACLVGYHGPVAVMSFNPHSVLKMAQYAPDVLRGLATGTFDANRWSQVPEATRARLRLIPDYEASGAIFISHSVLILDHPRVTELKAAGTPILCWVTTSQEAEDVAREIADNITFEGYPATIPAA